MNERMDEIVTSRMNKRYIELAAMLKEKVKGSQSELTAILSRFSLQEGLRKNRALEYFDILREAGLIKYTNGHKSWRYDASAEWDLFRVEI